MVGPLETWIIIGVFLGNGAVEGLEFKTETECLEYKYYLMEKWENDEVDDNIYMLECKNETTNRRS